MFNWDNSSVIKGSTTSNRSKGRTTAGFEVKIKDIPETLIIVEEEIGQDETYREAENQEKDTDRLIP